MKPFSNPLNQADATPAAVPAAPAPAFNSRPSKDQNQGASPALMGDKQKIVRPPSLAIASQPKPADRGQSYQASGIDRAMGELADKMHAPKRR